MNKRTLKRIKSLQEKYNSYITLEQIIELAEIFSKNKGYDGLSTGNFERIIKNLELYNYKENIDHQMIYDCLMKVYKRKEKLKSENLNPAKIDLDYINIFCDNEDDAKKYYRDYCKRKTETWVNCDPKLKDSKSLDFHIKKYGKEEGSRIYNHKRETTFKENSNCCIEWYLKRGYTEEEGRKLISERQATFTLDKCIEKYGKERGYQNWKDRQERWQETFKSKENYEEICKNRSPVVGLLNVRGLEPEQVLGVIQTWDKYSKDYILDIEEFKERMIQDRINMPIMEYWDKQRLIQHYGQTQLDLLGISDEIFEEYFELTSNAPYQPYKFSKEKTSFHSYCMRVEEGFLRSQHEINFYMLLKQNNIKFKLDKSYPDSNFRYDFYLIDHEKYVEICPMYSESDNEYDRRIDIKREQLGAILLRDMDEQYEFINSLL